MYYHRLVIYFDGAARNNPHGPAGCGWALYEMDNHGTDGNLIASGKKYLGFNISNNQAEYDGLYYALEYLSKNCITCHGLYIRGDSELVINQLNGTYQTRSQNIIDCLNDVMNMLGDVDYTFVKCTHIDRSRNHKADSLANDAIDYY